MKKSVLTLALTVFTFSFNTLKAEDGGSSTTAKAALAIAATTAAVQAAPIVKSLVNRTVEMATNFINSEPSKTKAALTLTLGVTAGLGLYAATPGLYTLLCFSYAVAKRKVKRAYKASKKATAFLRDLVKETTHNDKAFNRNLRNPVAFAVGGAAVAAALTIAYKKSQ